MASPVIIGENITFVKDISLNAATDIKKIDVAIFKNIENGFAYIHIYAEVQTLRRNSDVENQSLFSRVINVNVVSVNRESAIPAEGKYAGFPEKADTATINAARTEVYQTCLCSTNDRIFRIPMLIISN